MFIYQRITIQWLRYPIVTPKWIQNCEELSQSPSPPVPLVWGDTVLAPAAKAGDGHRKTDVLFRFPKSWVPQARWMVSWKIRKSPWIITGGSPFLGHLQKCRWFSTVVSLWSKIPIYHCFFSPHFISFPHLLLVSLYVVGQSMSKPYSAGWTWWCLHNDLRNAYPIVSGTNPKARSIRAILMCFFQIYPLVN